MTPTGRGSSTARYAALEAENRRLREALARYRSEAPRAAAGPPSGLTLQLLGVPAVSWRRGAELVEIRVRLRRSLHLLAFLALAPERRAHKSALLEALWPEAQAETTRRNFHPAISVLRRAVRDARQPATPSAVVVARAGVYALDPELAWEVDTEAFATAADAGDRHFARGDVETAARCWRAAWHQYRGPLLQEVTAEWLEAPRARLHQRYVAILRALGDLESRRQRWPDAVDAYRALLALEPLVEDAHLALLRAHARQGRRDLVRRQYEKLVRLLREELGIEPRLESTLEYHALMG